jgi:hypothetical protein
MVMESSLEQAVRESRDRTRAAIRARVIDFFMVISP